MSGTSWSEVFNAQTYLGTTEKVFVRWLNVSPDGNTVYALAAITYNHEGILLKSTNGGDTWTSISPSSPVYKKGISLAMDPTNSNTLYLGSENHGMYRSEDGGDTWQSINTGAPISTKSIYSVAVDPENPQTIFIGTEDTVYQSSNGGDNWQQLGDPIPDTTSTYGVVVVPSNAAKMYALVWEHGAYTLQTSDSFLLWTR